jgi:tetratricopeptide (TPR) repeat protein
MTFPLSLSAAPLVPADARRFSTLFVKALFEFFPCRSVELKALPLDQGETGGPSPLAVELFRELETTAGPIVAEDAGEFLLCLPLWNGERLIMGALLRGVDEAIFKAPAPWLLEQSLSVSRQLRYVKQSSLDPVTGLLNGFHLQSEIETLLLPATPVGTGDRPDPESARPLETSLAFLEVYPRGRDADRGLEYIVRAGTYLSSLLGQSVPLYHLGAGVFGLLWRGMSVENGRKMGDVLLRRLKRENFSSAHLGITSVIPADPDQPAAAGQLIEQAWQALRKARKRGPFTLFSHVTRREEEIRPLKKDSTSTFSWLRRLWLGKKKFSLVLVRQDQEAVSNHFSKRLRLATGQEVPLLCISQREAFLFLDNLGERETLEWLEQFRGKMIEFGGSPFSIGVALYPCIDFRKSAVPPNCRKALLHAGFYGPGAMALFDAVSLNISGDVYYNEGDLWKAVREYRKGLCIAPENLNLLNSLGVAYVQLNRPGMAVAVFEKVLAHDERNFMALLNLGFVSLNNRKREKAVEFFERALEVDGTHFDLLLHLGGLYCRQGRYREATAVLQRCVQRESDPGRKDGDYGAAYRHLGIAYEAQGDPGRAVSCLEKATALNARDAEALSRLGGLYLQEKQGDDIALSLCRQAVELDSSQADHWFRLGRVLEEQGNHAEALESFLECLRLKRHHPSAILATARLYQKGQKQKQARRMYERVLRLDPENKSARSALSALTGS